ncbi:MULTISPECIES: HGxxPAAW family protein [unclassified Actinotalea]|uniref:HGxxPAAW family protein n=1 Tax=unclassified Actinotalea TaxID=2638618 RepID=UPI0015F5E0DC|nr:MULTISPECIES: HGxxPAAW family protein [unclassified Actinotalea]
MRETNEATGEVSYLPPAAPPRNHGHTTAAWVTVILVLAGAVVSSIAMIMAESWLFWAGLVVILLGLVLGRVLKMLGFGQPGQKAGHHDAGEAAS